MRIDSLRYGAVEVQIFDGYDCFAISVSADNPDELASVQFNVKTGDLSLDGTGCRLGVLPGSQGSP